KASEAVEKADELRRSDYVQRVNLALHEVQNDNVAQAEDLLHGCPPELRGWEWNYVKRLAHLDRLTFRGHDQPVSCLAISADGRWIASGTRGINAADWSSDRSQLKLWNLDDGEELLTLGNLHGGLRRLAFSRDGRLLAAAGGYTVPEIKIWV